MADEPSSVEDESSDAAETEPGEDSVYLTRTEAIRMLGMSANTFDRKCRTKELSKVKVKGEFRYLREEIESYREMMRNGGDASAIIQAASDLLKVNTGLLSQAGEHVRALVGQVTGVIEKSTALQTAYLEAMKAEHTSMRTRVEQVEGKIAKAWDLFEQAAQNTHERELARVAATAGEKRKGEMWDTVKDFLPKLGEQIAGVAVTEQLFDTLTDEQVSAMLDDTIGFFTPLQREKFKHAYGKYLARKKRKDAEAKAKGEAAENAAKAANGAAAPAPSNDTNAAENAAPKETTQ